MVKTGYISLISESGGEQDEDGNPTNTLKIESEFVECNLSTIDKDYVFVVDSQYVKSNYRIYVDQDVVYSLTPSVDLESIKKVTIKDNNSNIIGSYQINNREYLNLTKRIKIEV